MIGGVLIFLFQLDYSSNMRRYRTFWAFMLLLIFILISGTFCAYASSTESIVNNVSLNSRAQANYDFTIECYNNSHLTNGGDPTGFYITINNTGIYQDTYLITFKILSITGGEDPQPGDWAGDLDKESISLGPNDSGIVILTVSSSCSCQEGSTATIQVTAESVNSPSVTGYVDTFTKYGPPEGSVRIEYGTLSMFSYATAGQTVDTSLNIYNLQSVDQTYILKHTKNPGRFGLSYLTEPFEVPQKDVVSVPVQITIPLENEPGSFNITFHIRSEKDSMIENSVEIPIELYPELAVTKMIPSNLVPKPNETVIFQVTVENLGPAVCRKCPINLYDGVERTEEHLIGSKAIINLFGNTSVTYDFTWSSEHEGTYNMTAFVNPALSIQEVSNRFGNNYKTVKISVQEKVEPPDGGGDGNTSEEDGKKDNESLMDSPMFFVSIGAIVCVIVVLLVLYLVYRSQSSSSGDDERTARKIPINRGIGSRSNYTARGKKKTARKEKLNGPKGRKHNRGRNRPHRHGKRDNKYRKGRS